MRIRWYLSAGLVGVTAVGAALFAVGQGVRASNAAEASQREAASSSNRVAASEGRPRVEVITPTAGGLERSTTQPGSVHAFESAELFAKCSGYLKQQYVDIGDRVKKGQVLAEIDMPELVKQVQREAALLRQAQAQVSQMKAHVATAVADQKVADANVKQMEADLTRVDATLSFREKQYARIKALYDLNSVDEKLVDEKDDERMAALAAQHAAQAAIIAAKAQVSAAAAKIDQAEADLAEAEARVQVSQAELEKTQVLLQYTKIVSPYDGVITARNFHVGDFIRAADQGAVLPLLDVAKTDLMRVVLQVPDKDVPLAGPGDLAVVVIDALPGRKFNGKVSRVANAEDVHTRTMRTEVDLPNSNGILREGMYGRVTIVLNEKQSQALTIPSSCLMGQSREGQGVVYVVRNDRLSRVQVRLGADNGLVTEVLSGLSASDQVVVSYNGAIGDGVLAEVVTN
jgi:RND family efflux transporter MFP subunit